MPRSIGHVARMVNFVLQRAAPQPRKSARHSFVTRRSMCGPHPDQRPETVPNQLTALAPVTGTPVAVAPVARNPDHAGTGRIAPVAADPDPRAASPLIVAGDPDCARARPTPAMFMIAGRRRGRTNVNGHHLRGGLSHSSKRRHSGDQRQRDDGKTSNFHSKNWTSSSPRCFKELRDKSFQFINIRRFRARGTLPLTRDLQSGRARTSRDPKRRKR